MKRQAAPFNSWAPFQRDFRRLDFTFAAYGRAASAINRIAKPYLWPIDYDNDRDHIKW